MQEYLPYVVLLGSFLMILSFAIIFLSFFLISQKKEEIEKDGKAVYDIQCGGRCNEKNITIHFCVLLYTRI